MTEPKHKVPQASSLQSQVIHLEGHLLDSGLVNQALDTIVSGGGSFKVLNLELGKQRLD